MKLVLTALAAPLLISASDAAIEAENLCSNAISKEQQQKAQLLGALERYKSCIMDDKNSAACLENYDKMSVIYSDYRNSTINYVEGCYINEH